jgi:hypothetical protein
MTKKEVQNMTPKRTKISQKGPKMAAILGPFWDMFWNSYLQIKAKMAKKEVKNMTPK